MLASGEEIWGARYTAKWLPTWIRVSDRGEAFPANVLRQQLMYYVTIADITVISTVCTSVKRKS